MVKSILKRWLSLMVAIAMVVAMLPTSAVYAAPGASTLAVSGSLDDTSIGVSISSNGTATSAGTTIDASVTGQAGSCGGSGTSKNATLTIKNNKTEAAMLSFVYEPTPNGGSVTFNGTAVSAKGTFSQEIAAGGTVTFVLTSAADAKTTSVKITEIKLIVEKNVTTTFKPGENGTYTVDGEAINAETTKTQSSTQAYTMVATPASGYKFFGWKSETTGKYVSNTANANLMLDSDQIIYPVFVSKDTALFSTNGAMYFDLNEAVAAAASDKNKRIVLAETGTLAAGNYNIPSGYTLLIPFDAAGTCYTTAPGVLSNSYTTPSAFRTLTMTEGASITVNGAISVSAKQTSGPGGGSYAGAPSGPYGYIKMSAGSSITCNNGGELYAWGYISGDGTVTMKSGSTVYEDMQIGDFRGGSASTPLVSNARGKAFLFNQYFIQNVEALMVYEAGATEKLYTSLYASRMTASSDATFIGPNGMFNLTNGTFTKKYNPNTDRLEVTVNGEAAIDSITVKVMSNSLDSGKYVLPITNNMTLDVQSGTTHLTQDIQMLAGVKVNVANGAKLDISSNSDIFLFDHDEWAGKNFAQDEFRTVSYSPTKKYSRKSSDLTDVKLDVNGTIDVNGHLYTTAGGADICSSEGTGVINMISGAGTATQTYQVANAESDVTAVPITSAKLHNGCNDPVYTETAGAEAGTVYTYDSTKDMWVGPSSEITITFDPNDGTGSMDAMTVDAGSEVTLPENTFTRDGYTFKNWATNADGTGTVYEKGATVTFDEDTILYAQWEKNTSEYTVTWVDEDGTELAVETYEEGATPSYKGQTPSKASDAQYTYEFDGWTPEVSAVAGDVTYKATYKSTLRSYTITWEDEDGAQLVQTTVPYGETPAYPNEEPTKEPTEDTTYHFAGWKNGENGIVPVTGDATYQATFESAVRTYIITWDIDGQTQTENYEYGATPSHAAPTKEATAQYEYTFKGWAPELSAVKGDQTYTANFDEVLRKYNVTWLNADGTELLSETVDYGTMAVYSGETPAKAEDDDYTYEFAGWNPETSAVTGDVTYTAQFNAVEKIKTYTITWLSDDGETVLRTDVVEAGQMPAYGENDPVKDGTAQYSYTFTGWDKEVVAAEADATYTAVFEETVNKYNVKFMNGDTVLQESEVEYGQKPEYTGAAPSKTGDAQFSYTFAGWDKEIVEVTENAVYSATFDVHTNTYTVTWVNYDGTVLETDEDVEYGYTPTYDGATPVQDGYEFIGWDPAVTPVGENITYTAQFEKIAVYDIIFQAKNPHTDEVITLDKAEVENGVVLAQPAAPSFIGYEFAGWNVAVGDENENVNMALDEVDLDELNEVIAGLVTEDTETVIITANYEKVTDTYTIKLEYVIGKTHVDAYTAEPREVGTSVNLSASEIYTDENGEKYVFDHWLINGKEYSSQSVTVTPKTGGKYTILAYYVDGDSKVVEPSVEFIDAYAEVVNGTNKMGLQMSYHVPEGFTFQSAGFVYSTKVAQPVIGNGTKSATKLTTPDGSYTVHISIGTKVDTTVYARAYLTYSNSNGESVTIYTDTNSYTWNRLNN